MKEKIAAVVVLFIALISFGCSEGKAFTAKPVALVKKAPEAPPVPLEQIAAGKDIAFAFAAEKYDPLAEDRYLDYVVDAKDRDAAAQVKATALALQRAVSQAEAELSSSNQQVVMIDTNSTSSGSSSGESGSSAGDSEDIEVDEPAIAHERYYNTADGYSIDFPEGWEIAETEYSDYKLVSAVSPPVGNSSQILESIGVTVEELPLELSSGEYLDMSAQFLEASFDNFHEVSRSDFTLDGLSGKKLVFTYTYKGATLQDVLYEVVKDMTAYLIIGKAEGATYSEYEGRFDAAASSFKFEN